MTQDHVASAVLVLSSRTMWGTQKLFEALYEVVEVGDLRRHRATSHAAQLPPTSALVVHERFCLHQRAQHLRWL